MVKMASEEEMMRQMMGFSGFGNSISIFSLFVTKNIDTNLFFFSRHGKDINLENNNIYITK